MLSPLSSRPRIFERTGPGPCNGSVRSCCWPGLMAVRRPQAFGRGRGARCGQGVPSCAPSGHPHIGHSGMRSALTCDAHSESGPAAKPTIMRRAGPGHLHTERDHRVVHIREPSGQPCRCRVLPRKSCRAAAVVMQVAFRSASLCSHVRDGSEGLRPGVPLPRHRPTGQAACTAQPHPLARGGRRGVPISLDRNAFEIPLSRALVRNARAGAVPGNRPQPGHSRNLGSASHSWEGAPGAAALGWPDQAGALNQAAEKVFQRRSKSGRNFSTKGAVIGCPYWAVTPSSASSLTRLSVRGLACSSRCTDHRA